MRLLYVSAMAATLSGCAWFGSGSQQSGYDYQARSAAYVSPGHANSCARHSHQGCLSTWNVEAAVGPAFIGGGTAITGDQVNPNSNANIDRVGMTDAYDVGIRGEGSVSYALTPNRKFTATGFYQRHSGNNDVEIGTIGDDTLRGTFSDFETYGAEGGIRQYFTPSRAIIPVRPYVEARLGGTYVQDIDLENANLTNAALPGGGTTPFLPGGAAVPLYEGGWVPTAAAMIGFETPIAPYTTIGVEAGARYIGTLKSDTSVLDATHPLGGANNGSSPWTIPVMLRGRYRF